jgi:hypothetical protein
MINEPDNISHEEEERENAKNFRLNILVFGGGLIGITILVSILKHFNLI